MALRRGQMRTNCAPQLGTSMEPSETIPPMCRQTISGNVPQPPARPSASGIITSELYHTTAPDRMDTSAPTARCNRHAVGQRLRERHGAPMTMVA